jgi:N-dimethylarginine dimethylaminohydrolase
VDVSAAYGLDSEYAPLESVLLSPAHPAVEDGAGSRKKLHAGRVEYAGLREECRRLASAYRALGVRRVRLDPAAVRSGDRRCLYNLVFTRDHFFMTPSGAIVSRMASPVRRGETAYAAACLRKAGIPVRRVVTRGSFEGADALWIDPGTVAVGVGNRTSREGFRQVREELAKDGIECVAFPAARRSLHLLGSLLFVDSRLCLARTRSLDRGFCAWLRRRGIRLIEVAESAELLRQGMNLVTVAPRTVLACEGCPSIARLLRRFSIRIAALLPAAQLANAGGGLACASGILARVMTLK